MNIEINDYLQSFVPLVNFLAEIVGRNSEVVLHDLTNLDTSVIAIRNNYITNREIGDPATDFVLKIFKENKHNTKDFVSNYKDATTSLPTSLRSSSFFIRYQEKLVGMICVNTDETAFHNVQKQLDQLMKLYTHNSVIDKPMNSKEDNFSSSIEEMSEHIVTKITQSKGVKVDYLKAEDKIEVIERLNDRGFFLLKGAVPEIARTLKISEPTVYRYLQVVKAK